MATEMTTEQALISNAANEAAQASYETVGYFVPASTAYDFIREERYSSLPDEMPRDFLLDYTRIARQMRSHNRFVANLGARQ